MGIRVLVCGSRSWTDEKRILMALLYAEYVSDEYIDTVIHGGAKGADTLAGTAAKKMCGYNRPQVEVDKNTPEVVVYPANWNLYGKAAGMIRNRQMLTEGKPDLVLAFWDGKSRGTANMIAEARKAGVEVKVILEEMGGEA